jgi:nucleoside-diphosphate-sugar epimerase
MIEGNNKIHEVYRIYFPDIHESDKKLYVYHPSERTIANDNWKEIFNNYIDIFKKYNKIVIDNGFEAMNINIVNKITNFLKENNVTDVLYIDGGLDSYFKNKIIYIPRFIINDNDKYVKLKDRSILYISLARFVDGKFQRLFFTYELYRNNLLSDGIVTCASSSEQNGVIKGIDLFPEDFQKIMPILYDGLTPRSYGSIPYLQFGQECLINVVQESSFDIIKSKNYPSYFGDLYWSSRPFFTEKTAKAFNSGQIPLFVTVTGYVSILKTMGFDVFDDIVDHSYDNEIDPDKRILMVVEELLRLKEIGLENLKNIYGLEDRLLYNKNHLTVMHDQMFIRYKQKFNTWFFEKRKIKYALVLGAGGFIGSHLVKKLKRDGYWVRGVDLKYPLYSKTEADDFVIGDLRQPELVSSIMLFPIQIDDRVNSFDEVYQLAADMGGAGYIFTGENDANIMHNSALINLNVANESIKKNIKKLFFSSSACVYPKHNQSDPNNPNCEESSAYPADPDSEYGWEKIFSERLYSSYNKNYGLDIRIARFHNIFGEEGTFDGGKEKAPAALCRKVSKSEDGTIEIWGDGTQTRSFLYIDECLEAVGRLMESDYTIPVNIGSEEIISINDLAKMIIEISQKDITIKNIDGPVGIMGRNSNNKLFEENVGWKVSQPLKIGIEKLYKWIYEQLEKNKVIFGIENYCTCKYHGEETDSENLQWFLKIDKIPIKNGFTFDNIIFDFEEIFDVENEKKYFEINYDDKTRYFRKLRISSFIINKYSLTDNFKSVDDLIKSRGRFFFMIDCGDFPNIKNIILSEKIINLVNDNKCIITLNTSYEPFSNENKNLYSNLEFLADTYNLNKDNFKILSGNLLSPMYNNSKYEFIPYCYFLENPWFIQKESYAGDLYGRHTSKNIYKSLLDKKEVFLQNNREITKFDKKILFYNRRPHSHRRYIFYHLYNNDLIRENSYMSLNSLDTAYYWNSFNFPIGQEEINKINEFYKDNKQCWSFDDIDLNINLSNNFEEDYHKKTFLSLVSETCVDENIIFLSEKTFKPIYACQPFIISGNAFSLKKLKEFGFMTFDKWWDESYDNEYFFNDRVKKIKDVLIEISLKTDEELSKMLIEMESVLSHNYDVFINYKNKLLLNGLSNIIYKI